MDLSPKTLREVEFREKLRGYHPEDVDQFLERVAAGIEALQDKLRQTAERAVHAEELASATGETDDALRRTLVLAQKTADAAVEEARAQAADIVGTAEQQAGSIVAEAKSEAVRIATDAQHQLREDLEILEAARARLLEDVSQLEQWIGAHRGALSAALGEALRQVDQGVLVASPPPELSDVDVPVPPTVDAPIADGADVSAPVDAEQEDPAVSAEADADAAESTPFDQDRRGEAVNAADAVEEDEGPVIEHDENDAYMVELRRAVTDEEPLGPRDEDAEPAPVAATNDAGFYADEGDANRRFGSRRRRRR